MVKVELKEWGNSIGVILPSDKLKRLKLRKGDKIEIEILTKERIDGFGMAKGAESFEDEDKEHESLFYSERDK